MRFDLEVKLLQSLVFRIICIRLEVHQYREADGVAECEGVHRVQPILHDNVRRIQLLNAVTLVSVKCTVFVCVAAIADSELVLVPLMVARRMVRGCRGVVVLVLLLRIGSFVFLGRVEVWSVISIALIADCLRNCPGVGVTDLGLVFFLVDYAVKVKI